MRWFNFLVITLFAIATAIFAMQNLQVVDFAFLGANVRTRLAFLIIVAYALGALTGGSLWALLRRAFEGASHRSSGPVP